MDSSTRPQVQPNATGTGHKYSFNVINSHNNIFVDRKPQILEWLSPLEPRISHQYVRTQRLDGVGEWFLKGDKFTNWRDGKGEADKSVLFCSGNPGVGKTYLSSLVIDALCDGIYEDQVAVACLYCDFRGQKEQTTTNMLGALVKQLVLTSGTVPSQIEEAFEKSKGQIGGRGLRVPEIIELLYIACSSGDRAFICIDALDEFPTEHLPELLRSLSAISHRMPEIRFFITGRPHLRSELDKFLPGVVQVVDVKPTNEDIRIYLERMFEEDSMTEAMDDELKTDIMGAVSERFGEVFLLVSLNIVAILGETTIQRRREKLEEMAGGIDLEEAYDKTLARIKELGPGRQRDAMAALMWISRSERQMKSDELCNALSVQMGSMDINPLGVPSIYTLLASCLGLIRIDEAQSTVRLVHFTLQEYLLRHSELFPNPHSTMAEACLEYLNFDYVKTLSPNLIDVPPETPFLQYASRYWIVHARSGMTKKVKSLALRLLDDFDRHVAAKLLLLAKIDFGEDESPTGFTGLHCVAYSGMDEILGPILEKEDTDVDKVDFRGRTALAWATTMGHEEIVRKLLTKSEIFYTQRSK